MSITNSLFTGDDPGRSRSPKKSTPTNFSNRPSISNLTRTLLHQKSATQPPNINSSGEIDLTVMSPPFGQLGLSLGHNPVGSQQSIISSLVHQDTDPTSKSFFLGPQQVSVSYSFSQRIPSSILIRRDYMPYDPSSHDYPYLLNSLYPRAVPMSMPVPSTAPSHYSYNGTSNFKGFASQPAIATRTMLINGVTHSDRFNIYSTTNSSLQEITTLDTNSVSNIGHPAYVLYADFVGNLTLNGGTESHVNIVEYPVQDLIKMLACLLSKIIEANDKLHPKHFDKTIAIRQRLKLQKPERRAARQNQNALDNSILETKSPPTDDAQPSHYSLGYQVSANINHSKRYIDLQALELSLSNLSDSLDEEAQEEVKNKYLANVLAFHGTNVPGISLHDYLSRVLKYCPVTNEVFLLLLVYFDRIAKKANQLQSLNPASGMDVDICGNGDASTDEEQLFVMDLYNIHRLVIAGITVLSKFFLDIFYKNFRYAKVGGLPLEELNYLELQFLLMLDFKLMVSMEEMQNYGDLLRRFYQREQI